MLSAVIEAVTVTPAVEVTAERLFRPFGIERSSWPTDPQGRHSGCGGLELAARDLLKLGLLYLDMGVWNGTRIVGED